MKLTFERRLRESGYRKKLYARLRAEGHCTACRKPKPEGMTQWWCQSCRDKKNAEKRACYQIRKAAGVCVECEETDTGGHVLCAVCRELNRMRKVKRDDSLADTIG